MLFGSLLAKLFEVFIDFVFGSFSAFWTALAEIVNGRVTATTRIVTNGPQQELARRINEYPPSSLPSLIQLVSLCSACIACYLAGRFGTGVTGKMGILSLERFIVGFVLRVGGLAQYVSTSKMSSP